MTRSGRGEQQRVPSMTGASLAVGKAAHDSFAGKRGDCQRRQGPQPWVISDKARVDRHGLSYFNCVPLQILGLFRVRWIWLA